MTLKRASQQARTSALAFCVSNIYGLSGVFGLIVGGLLTLWMLVPSYLPEVPKNPHKAMLGCAENGRQCENIHYEVRLLPNPSGLLPSSTSEDVIVQVRTSRRRSNGTAYHLLWPGRALPWMHDRDWLQVMVESHNPQVTQLRVKGATPEEIEPPPPVMVLGPPVEFDQFAFVWVGGKERQNFTDWQLRLALSTDPSIMDQVIGGQQTQATLTLMVGLRASQRLIMGVPDSVSSSIPFPEFGAALHTYDSDKVIVVYTEKNLGILSQYSLVVAGILLGVGANLLTQQVVVYCEEWRR